MVKLYPDSVYENPPSEFDDRIVELAGKVKEAVKGWGTDENALLREIGDENAADRLALYYCYKEQYGDDLKAVMDAELGDGNLGLCMQLLCLPLDKAEAKLLKMAMSGVGTKETAVYSIICGRENEEINRLKATFFTMFETDLATKLGSELGGEFERLIFFALQGLQKDYDEDYFNEEKVEADVTAFYQAGQGQWGADEASLFKIIAESPPEHLEKVSEKYTEKYEVTLIGALNTEVGGDAGKGAKFAVGMKLKPAKTVAALIAEACEGFGTDEVALTSAILRFQAIMPEVNEAHVEEYGKSIVERIESEVTGKYKRLLVKMVENSL